MATVKIMGGATVAGPQVTTRRATIKPAQTRTPGVVVSESTNGGGSVRVVIPSTQPGWARPGAAIADQVHAVDMPMRGPVVTQVSEPVYSDAVVGQSRPDPVHWVSAAAQELGRATKALIADSDPESGAATALARAVEVVSVELAAAHGEMGPSQRAAVESEVAVSLAEHFIAAAIKSEKAGQAIGQGPTDDLLKTLEDHLNRFYHLAGPETKDELVELDEIETPQLPEVDHDLPEPGPGPREG